MSLIRTRKKRKKRNVNRTLFLVSYVFYFHGKKEMIDANDFIPIKVFDTKKQAQLFCESKNFEFQNLIFTDNLQVLLDYEQEEDNLALKENIVFLREKFVNEFAGIEPKECWRFLDQYKPFDWQYIKYEKDEIIED